MPDRKTPKTLKDFLNAGSKAKVKRRKKRERKEKVNQKSTRKRL